ncbi:Focadhesin [Lamellibrachia satsuma]|nr:Focadhesin [Lamellibrachia satsuma]
MGNLFINALLLWQHLLPGAEVHSHHSIFLCLLGLLASDLPIGTVPDSPIEDRWNLAGILTALTDLLAMQLTAQAGQGHYKCPYSIRNPPHPFVTVVTNRPDSWPLLQQQVQRLLTWPDHRVKTNALQLMEPFLKFVLLEPRQSPSFSALRTALVTGLLQGAPREMRQNIIEFLMKLLPCMQMDNTSSLGEVIMCVHSLVSYLHQHDAGHLSQIRTLSTHILALCVVAQKQGLDTGQLLEGLTTLIADHSEGVCSSSDILHLVELLSTSTERQWSSILQVLKHYTLQPMDRFLAGTLVLPLLSIIATPTSSVATQLASQVLGHVERVTASDNHPQDTSVYGHSCLRPETYSYQTYARLARHFSQNEAAAADWLTSIQSSLPNAGHVTYQLTSLVASILIVSKEQRIVGISLKVLTGLAETAMNQAPDLLPLLVYKLGRETRSEVKLEILHTMAETATHKVAIVPVLRTFQMLGMSACLKPVVLRLVTLLWKHQDRCFPHLQNMLLEKESDLASGKSLINEGLIARAASIRDICQNRPHQHGADMLVLVSAILNECTGEREAVAVAMALEGLRYLCEAEVVDIRTAWSVLAAKLQHDERSLVMCEVCRLFSLVPALEVTTREYEVFMSRAVDMLWMYTQSSDMAVASAAFQSLAKFHPSVFTIEHLPKEFHPDLEESTGSKDVDLKDVAQSRIAGDVYIRLMQSLPESLIPAYTELEKALVSHEVASVSRSILHTRTARTANPNKAFAAIPECIQSRYDRNPPPELRPSLAIGLLLSYDPLVPVGRDGKPRKQHIVQHGRSFHQMFYTLMNEVTMSLTEWNELLLLPQAWTLFMQRCFSAYLEVCCLC